MSLGLPFISYPWQTHVEAGALPTPHAHYIPTREVARHPDGHAIDPGDAAEAIISAHRWALRQPAEWLRNLGRRAQRWYDQRLNSSTIALGILNLLDLESGW